MLHALVEFQTKAVHTQATGTITTIATLGRDTLGLCIGVSRPTRTVRVGRNE